MSKKSKLIKFCLLGIILCLSFFKVITRQTESTGNQPPQIRAAIVPHHLVASAFVEDLATKLKTNQIISQIIIIGPNHDEIGQKNFITDDESISKNSNSIEYAPNLVNKDHACFAPSDILKKYFPDIKISCILISSRSTNEEINLLSQKLSLILNNTGVLVSSVDFSHYQNLIQANENDLLTQKYLQNFDISSILHLGNDFLDSPKTIAILFRYLSLNHLSQINLINHSNSAIILNTPYLSSTTSYFEYIFY